MLLRGYVCKGDEPNGIAQEIYFFGDLTYTKRDYYGNYGSISKM
jgi:hypothetical protein